MTTSKHHLLPVFLFKHDKLTDPLPNLSIAKEVVAERFGDSKITKQDMLGSFVAHGLDQKDAEQESLVQM